MERTTTKETAISPEHIGLEQAYRELRPQFFHALATLARRGFAVSASDALDLIHDFFLEEWEAVCARFDPAKGTFENYSYGAFVHFSRPRILKLRRLQDSLVDSELLESLYSTESYEDLMAVQIDAGLVSKAITQLPLKQRCLLEAYLNHPNRSEREIGREFSLSRYAVRETLVAAIGRLITYVERPKSISESDWSIAKAIWGQRRTVSEAASLYGISPSRVKHAMARLVVFVVLSLREFRREADGDKFMASPGASMTPEMLLHQALSSPGNTELLNQLKARAPEVLEALDRHDIAIPDAALNDAAQLWVAQVYETLSGDSHGPAQDGELAKYLFDTSEREAESIGHAFKETLLPDLPLDLVRFEVAFERAPKFPIEEVNELMDEPDMRASFPFSTGLAIYGITPMKIFFATEAVSALLDRLLRQELVRSEPIFIGHSDPSLYIADGSGRHATVSIEDEIAKVIESPEGTASVLFHWLLRVSEYRAHVFGGFIANAKQHGIELRRTAEKFSSLYDRWGRILVQCEYA